MFKHKEGKGSLFKNEVNEHSKAPDYTGSITIKGEVYDLSGWVDTTKNKDKFISISTKKVM